MSDLVAKSEKNAGSSSIIEDETEFELQSANDDKPPPYDSIRGDLVVATHITLDQKFMHYKIQQNGKADGAANSGSSYVEMLDFTNADTFRFLDNAINEEIEKDTRYIRVLNKAIDEEAEKNFSPSQQHTWTEPTNLENSLVDAPTDNVTRYQLYDAPMDDFQAFVQTEASIYDNVATKRNENLPTVQSLPISAREESTDNSAQGKERESNEPSKVNKSSSPSTPRIGQWITLWKLRHDLRRVYTKLIAATDSEGFPQAGKVKHLYRDATHMLQIGLSTFQGILEGVAPSTLQRTLAFVCVSKLMWASVHRNSKEQMSLSSRNPFDSLPMWRSGISCPSERNILGHVVRALWNVEIDAIAAKNEKGKMPACQSQSQEDILVVNDISQPEQNSGRLYPPSFPFAEWDGLLDITGIGLPIQGGNNPVAAKPPMPTMTKPDSNPPNSLIDSFFSEVDLLLTQTSENDDIRFGDFLHIPDLDQVLSGSNPDKPYKDSTTIEGNSVPPATSSHFGSSFTQMDWESEWPDLTTLASQYERPDPGPSSFRGTKLNLTSSEIGSTMLSSSFNTEFGFWGSRSPPQSPRRPKLPLQKDSSSGTLVESLIKTVLFQAAIVFLRGRSKFISS